MHTWFLFIFCVLFLCFPPPAVIVMPKTNTHPSSSSEDDTNSAPTSPRLSPAAIAAAEAATSALNLERSGEQQGTVAPVSQAATVATTTVPPPPPPPAARGPHGVGVRISISEAGEGSIRWRPSASSVWSAPAAIPPTTANPLPMSPNSITTATALLEQAFQQPPPPPQEPTSNKRQRGEMDVPSGPPVCQTCHKLFRSWKAVFGHMRMHKERTYRGAFPPPVSSDGCSSSNTIAATTPPRRRGLEIDLNIQFNPDEDIDVHDQQEDQALTTPPPPPPALEPASIDLNEPAAANKSDEKEGDGSTSNNDESNE